VRRIFAKYFNPDLVESMVDFPSPP
jgi:hypothetical protein